MICPVCHKDFFPLQINMIYCSKRCRDLNNHRKRQAKRLENGREIFEGDKVTFKPQKVTVPIVFTEGVWFGIYSPVQRLNLAIYQSKDLEIVD